METSCLFSLERYFISLFDIHVSDFPTDLSHYKHELRKINKFYRGFIIIILNILMAKVNDSEDKPGLIDYLQWDIYVWSKALTYWEKILKERKISQGLALEIGSKDGGLSLFLSYNFNTKVICSDLTAPSENAKSIHKKFNVSTGIEYSNEDAAKLSFQPNTFDIVIFKSVLGSVGRNDNYDKQRKTINEMYRVLKPNGILLFAENGKASFLHSILRKIFSKWASYWRYVSLDEMINMLCSFSFKDLRTGGFISAFVPGNGLKKIIFPIDNFIEKLVPEKSRYVIYGYAVK